MSEFHDAFTDSSEDDPRTQLTDILRGFFLRAVSEQELRDAERAAARNDRVQPGSLYKTDGNFLKVYLQVPADDVVFHGTEVGRRDTVGTRSDIWLLLPLLPEDRDFDLRDTILSAEDIILNVRTPDGAADVNLLVNDGYVGPADVEDAALDKLLELSDSTEEGDADNNQQQIATHWIGLLEDYDLRTIASTTTN